MAADSKEQHAKTKDSSSKRAQIKSDGVVNVSSLYLDTLNYIGRHIWASCQLCKQNRAFGRAVD